MFALRFDLRNPEMSGTNMADRYEAALDMAKWADGLGCVSITLSEHHGSPDGYLPSPLPMVSAMAARTTNVHFLIAALVAPFYDPVRLAEDMLVIDNLSRGRVDLVVGAGYVREEFELYGVGMGQRAKRVTDTITILRSAFAGEPLPSGRKVTPAPFRPGGPKLLLGGSSEAAARRAARIADGFLPSVPDVWDYYRDEVRLGGGPDPGPYSMGSPRTIALAEDPDRGWQQMGPFFLHETNSYGALLAENDGAGPYEVLDDIDAVRSAGGYAVLTPDQLIEEMRASPFPFVAFHPLCGGMPPELAWSSLRLFEQQVLPALASTSPV